jgi:hypothetical protein
MSKTTVPTEAVVDIRPISFDLAGAMAYSGLSRWMLNKLLREEKIVARQEGTKNLFMRDSLDRYILSLPARGSR